MHQVDGREGHLKEFVFNRGINLVIIIFLFLKILSIIFAKNIAIGLFSVVICKFNKGAGYTVIYVASRQSKLWKRFLALIFKSA